MKLAELNKPYIIAEVGSAWSNYEQVKDSIGLAKNCGADCVKFQLFTEQELHGPMVDNKESGKKGVLHHGWLEGLKEKADAFGIDLMCSAFSVDGLKAVDPYVKMHKLASSENNHIRMLEALNALGKPVLVSTGGSNYGDLEKTISYLPDVEVVPLYCVSDYPARNIDLSELGSFSKLRGIVGFSDHSTDAVVIPKRAAELGAVVIEKHVNFYDVESPDSGHSLSRDEFKAMCDTLRGRKPSPSGQKEMTLKHNRRLIAITDIKAGEQFKEDINFGIYRSLVNNISALSPFHIEKVNGKKCRRDIKAGEGISPDAVFVS